MLTALLFRSDSDWHTVDDEQSSDPDDDRGIHENYDEGDDEDLEDDEDDDDDLDNSEHARQPDGIAAVSFGCSHYQRNCRCFSFEMMGARFCATFSRVCPEWWPRAAEKSLLPQRILLPLPAYFTSRYWCRHCHNEAEETVAALTSVPPTSHTIDRYAVKEASAALVLFLSRFLRDITQQVVCAQCSKRQPVSNLCSACGTQFGKAMPSMSTLG